MQWSCTSGSSVTSLEIPPTFRCIVPAKPTTPRTLLCGTGVSQCQHRGRVIVVGADNEYVPNILWL